MSTYSTDPNMHEATAYGTGAELLLAVSRNTAEHGAVRLDPITLGDIGPDDEPIWEGVCLARNEAIDLANHLLSAAYAGTKRPGCLSHNRGDRCCLMEQHKGSHLNAEGRRWR